MYTNNINFKGYKNIVSTLATNKQDLATLYLTMELNDDDGHRDLSEFKKIREMQGYNNGGLQQNIINMTYFTDLGLNSQIYLGTERLFSGAKLKDLYEMKSDKKLSEDEYKSAESIHLKAYTLLASLTKRIAEAIPDEETVATKIADLNSSAECKAGIRKVIENLYYVLSNITKNQYITHNLIEGGVKNQPNHKYIAQIFNRIIQSNMNYFFK